MKSLAMLNLNRLSPDSGRTLSLKLDILIKNGLYTTHQVDKILKILKSLTVDKDLQKQVDMYFDDNGEAHLGSEPETSPQTDSDEQ